MRLKLCFTVLLSMQFLFGAALAEVTVGSDEYVIFYTNDVLGSPVAVSDDKGRVLWYENTHPFGKSLNRRNAGGDNFSENEDLPVNSEVGYTGHEVDSTTNLIYMRARYYDADIGRFYSNDPVGFVEDRSASFNRYSYLSNNPYFGTDPTGMYGPDNTAETELTETDELLAQGQSSAWDYFGYTDYDNADPQSALILGAPEAPPGVDVAANIAEAISFRRRVDWNGLGLPAKLAWFYSKVANGKIWDYKVSHGKQYEAFGNYHYGLIGASLGIPNILLINEAGISNLTSPFANPALDGKPGPRWNPHAGTRTHGDNPVDAYNIMTGVVQNKYAK